MSLVIAIGIAVCGALASGMDSAAVASARSDEAADAPAVVVEEADGLRYEYHAFTGREFLWRADATNEDRRNLVRELPDAALQLRRACELRLGLDSLDVLHAPHREAAEALHGLGYL